MSPLTGEMRGLTVFQPWASALFLGKSCENRKRRDRYRGWVALHAGVTTVQRAVLPDVAINKQLRAALNAAGGWWDDPLDAGRARNPLLAVGAVIGVAWLSQVHSADCCTGACGVWGEQGAGVFHWVFKDPQPLRTPMFCRGQRGLWPVPPEVREGLVLAEPESAGSTGPADAGG